MMWVISYGQPSNVDYVGRSASLPDLVIFHLGTKETLALGWLEPHRSVDRDIS